MNDKIISLLKSKKEYVSGEEISQKFGISRAAIWKHINELRLLGYKIDAVSHCGYRLKSSPDKLFHFEVLRDLRTEIIGQKMIYKEEVSSTMDEAFQLALNGEKEGTVVCAERQTKGRGRMGRVWVSPKLKGIYLSIILRPSLPPSNIARLTLLVGVALCEAINRISPVGAEIKWPNDVLIKGKKVAGILTEINAEMDRVRFCIIGLGVNVNTALRVLPSGSTSLKNETGRCYSRVKVTQEILKKLDFWYGLLKKEGFASIIERWKELSSTLGRHIIIKDQDRCVEGKAIDLDEYGGLVIKTRDGRIVKRMSGDVIQ
ncbi:MAG TPA: biotin--[acetyl-CoA-carboxylase] ligase [Candidatus Omnitrophota bacterium]|nr:biotin--[acetyl-CoA-carboxylase] ligase [Candidatus Omnitrophota bacterium]